MTSRICYYEEPGNEPLPRLIYHTAQDMKNVAEKILAPHDLTIEQFQPLKVVSFAPGISQRQLGDECNKSAANLTRILDRLQKKSLIERRDDPDDRRASLVYLTSQGESLVDKVTGILESFTDKFVAGISRHDQHIIRQAFHKMTANLQKLDRDIQTK